MGKTRLWFFLVGVNIILGQFDNINDYKKFAKEVAESARENKKMKREESTIDLLE